MRGYSVFRVPTEAPGPTSGEVANPQVGSIFWRPARLSRSFYSAVDGGPPGCAGVEGPGAPTISVKTLTMGPWEVPELKVRERPPST
jgi:hypothetical protein